MFCMAWVQVTPQKGFEILSEVKLKEVIDITEAAMAASASTTA